MHDTENEVRELLRERSGDVGVDPRIPRRVVRRSHRRRALTAGSSVVGLAAAVLLATVGLRGLARSTDDPTVPAREPSPSPSGEAPAVRPPATFVGSSSGAIVLVSAETGEIVRTIADAAQLGMPGPGFEPDGLAVSPDGSTVYLSLYPEKIDGQRIVRVPVEGGELEDLGWGDDPAASPLGDVLAYRDCSRDLCGRALVLLDLASGRKTIVGLSDPEYLVGRPVWLADGRLAVPAYPPGDSPGEIAVIDPVRPPADLLEAPTVPNPVPDTVRWGLYGSHAPTGGLIVGQEACCGATPGPIEMVSVDPETGEVLARVVDGGWWQVHPDASGRHLLLLDEYGGRAYVAVDGGEPALVAEGFADVAW